MLNAKLGLSAALLEINAWSGPLLFESNSDLVLLWYLGGHALASLLLAAFVQGLLPAARVRRRRRQRGEGAGLGAASVERHVYPGAQHEVLNETHRDEVIAVLVDFVRRTTA